MYKSKILLVDDELSLLRLIKLSLERTGRFEVRSEHLASRALNAARAFKPDLILLDVMMPDQDGGSVAASVRADVSLAGTEILFLTAAIKKAEVNQAKGLIGGFPFLAKPIQMSTIIECIYRTIHANRKLGAAEPHVNLC